jgi:hypothetical protein
MTLDHLADERGLTIAMRARQIELASTIHGAIAVIVRLALEHPLVTHLVYPPGFLKKSMCNPDEFTYRHMANDANAANASIR